MPSLDESIQKLEDEIVAIVTPVFVRRYFPIDPKTQHDPLSSEFEGQELTNINAAVRDKDDDLEMEVLSRNDRLLQAYKIGSILEGKVIEREDMPEDEILFYNKFMHDLEGLYDRRRRESRRKGVKRNE